MSQLELLHSKEQIQIFIVKWQGTNACAGLSPAQYLSERVGMHRQDTERVSMRGAYIHTYCNRVSLIYTKKKNEMIKLLSIHWIGEGWRNSEVSSTGHTVTELEALRILPSRWSAIPWWRRRHRVFWKAWHSFALFGGRVRCPSCRGPRTPGSQQQMRGLIHKVTREPLAV